MADYGALLDLLRGVSWPARGLSRGTAAGAHPSRLRGSSAEFTEYRAYRQGDDPRRLDWKLLARTDRPFLRITSERATLPTLLVVDGSASMWFPAGPGAKWARARELAVGLAAVAHGAGDPIALIVPGAGGRRLPFRARPGAVADLARALDEVTPGGSAELAPAITAPTSAARIVLITDLLGDGAGLLRAAALRITRGIEVVVAHVVATEELDPPAEAHLAIDPEHPEVERTLTAETVAAYRAGFDGWRAETAAAWRAAGARYLEVRTDEAAHRAVRRLVAR